MGHKARSLTQVNKKHKNSSKPNNNSKKLPKICKKKIMQDSKELRKLKEQQLKKLKIQQNKESDYAKLGNNDSAPLLCGIFPLFEFNQFDILFAKIKDSEKDVSIKNVSNIEGYSQVNCESFLMKSKKLKKNFAFVTCKNFRDKFDYMDLAKVVDWAIFLLPQDLDEFDGNYTKELFMSLISQRLPSSCFLLLNQHSKSNLKAYQKEFEKLSQLNVNDNIYSLNNNQDMSKLMRHLSTSCKPSYVSTKKSASMDKSINSKRGYFLTQHIKVVKEDDELLVRGCMRGYGLNLNLSTHLHITDVGDFAIKEARWLSASDSHRSVFQNRSDFTHKSCVVDAVDQSADLMDLVNKMDITSAVCDENESSDEDDEMDSNDDDEDEECFDIESYNSDDDKVRRDADGMSYATTAQSGYSLAQIEKFRKAREDKMFPDEIELAPNESGREKLKEYRGIKNFRESIWPTNENLPHEYAKIHEFKNYKHDKNRLNKMIKKIDRETVDNFVHKGCIVELVLTNFKDAALNRLGNLNQKNKHIICSALFPCEQNISIVHASMSRLSSVDDRSINQLASMTQGNDLRSFELGEEAISYLDDATTDKYPLEPAAESIRSRETMVMQFGFRRFVTSPVYSILNPSTSEAIGSRGKTQFSEFMHTSAGGGVLSSMYGPVTYGPCSAMQWRVRQIDLGYGEMSKPYTAELVATGSLVNIDPSRPIIKRVQLSGQIVKCNKQNVVVRYMFFNNTDVDYFKEVPLTTSSGVRGYIYDTRGTHGLMKCHFKSPLSQADVVLMPLYKRVFPDAILNKQYNLYPTEVVEVNDDKEMVDDIFQ